MTLRRRTVEHVFGTLKHWMGSTHFLTRTLEHVSTEMSLHVLAYNLKRVLQILGIAKMMKAIAYFSPSWTAFQADRGRDFSVIVDGVSV